MLYKCYIHEVYDSKNVLGISLSFILITVETHPLLAYTDTWQTSVKTMPKLRAYKTFKSELKTEAYVKANVLNTRQRSTISKMRTGTYPLEIELGRYRGVPEENRLCKLCRCEPEIEEHFMLNVLKLIISDKHKTMLSNVLVAKYVANFTIPATEKKHKLLGK